MRLANPRFVAFSMITFMLLGLLSPTVIRGQPSAPQLPPAVTSRRGMVVSVSEAASKVGRDVLAQGGNAVDAAVATAFALAVTYPPAGNIGGGGFMMILPKPGQVPVCIDYRETAPAAATATMFALGDNRCSAKFVGVPGTVRGLALAHQTYGKLPWKRAIEPAIRLARDGFIVNAFLAKSLNGMLRDAKTKPHTEIQRVYAPRHGDRWAEGDRLTQPDLASTLQRIADDGTDGFYRGRVAAAMVAEMTSGDGLITARDLATYRARVRRPVHTTFRGCDVYGPALPSSGGVVLAEMLNILENFDLKKLGHNSPAASHLVIEAMRRAYLDRARYLGDEDFVTVPGKLTTKQYAAQLAAQIDLYKATPSESLAPDIRLAPEGNSTTHFSVVDQSGMAVSNTYTLEQSYGSRIMVRGAGFLLNNEMGDFNWVPGHTDRKGRIGTRPNLIQPGKRMLSSQTPVLILRGGRPYLLTGSPGGRTIINTVLCVVLNVLEFDMDLPHAVAARRLHHPWLPDRVRFEGLQEPECKTLVQQLKAMGHLFAAQSGRQGDAHSILIDPRTGTMIGVADRRIDGHAAGVQK